MRDDIKLFVYRSAGEPNLIIRVRSMDGMDESTVVSGLDMERCRNADEKAILLRDAIQDLADRTIIPFSDLLRMSGQGENAQYCREFMFPRPRIVPQPKPEPVLETGWMGFLSGVAAAIMEAHKNYVLPKARVVKGGKLR